MSCCANGAELRVLRAQLAEAQLSLAETHEVLTATQAALAKAEAELKAEAEAHACLRRSVEAANAPVIAVDRFGLITRWNRKAVEVFGCSSEAALGTPLANFLDVHDRDSLAKLQEAVLKTSSAARGSVHLHRRCSLRSREGRKPKEVLLAASSCHSGRGSSCEGVFFVAQEVTAFGEAVLDAEHVAQDKLIREVNAPLIAVDAFGCVEEWNRKAELLTGFSKEEAFGKNLVKGFLSEEVADSVQTMLSQCMNGQEFTNHEFSLWTKSGQRKEILWSFIGRRNAENCVVGVIGIGQDITELRSESKMLANYVRICGAAVWSLKGNANTGVVTDSKTKEIEHLISQQAQMDVCDPRMVLWRASFVSILKTMCQNFWMTRKSSMQGPSEKVGATRSPEVSETDFDFGYEFCFEAPNGSVKWYKVQGHLIQECTLGAQFEVTGSMQEVTSMLIDKVMGDRWQKWWSRMCHMVFDATLLVDTQEYRVLNAWGEEKVFGTKLQSHHPLLQLIKPEDTVSLKEAFNEVTFKGFERGRTLNLLRPGNENPTPAQCFLLSCDQENPNECMMGIRMQVTATDDSVSVLWDVAKPNPVLTLEDLARLKSGLKRSHRRPVRNMRNVHQRSHRSRPADPLASSHSLSLSSIPEDLHGEFEEDDDLRSVSDMSDRGSEAGESMRSSSKSSNSSTSNDEGISSEVGVCNSSPARSTSEDFFQNAGQSADYGGNPFSLSPKMKVSSPPSNLRRALAGRPNLPLVAAAARPPHRKARVGPPVVKLRWSGKMFNLNFDEFRSISHLREHIQEVSGVPALRQTLILGGKRLPFNDEDANEPTWQELKDSIDRPGQTLMMIGSAPAFGATGSDVLQAEAEAAEAAAEEAADAAVDAAEDAEELPN
eukprot:TRINITY_DN33255_c0_g1_i1.p1 TRINITY_DN33255_c0_g1~~TRINITY_DN33255_c0_g1_i1.p1  ORF type:complete len:905 (+),score=192.47 TRINITY_DN33255_c0_g1_i1:59-2716(+)